VETGTGADTGFGVSAIPKELSLAVKLARQSLRDRRLHNTKVGATLLLGFSLAQGPANTDTLVSEMPFDMLSMFSV
jgi:hypothetical protein